MATSNFGNGIKAITIARHSSYLHAARERFRTERIIRTTDQAVRLTVGAPASDVKRILIAVDLSSSSHSATHQAVQLSRDASLIFIHAFHLPDAVRSERGLTDKAFLSYIEHFREAARESLNRFVDQFDFGPRLVSRIVQYGQALPVIEGYAQKMKPDAIVLGREKKTTIKLVFGGMAWRVHQRTGYDVLIAASGTMS